MRELLRSPIIFNAGGFPVHAPMIHASVAGTESLFVLDTGTTDHVWTKDLVSRVGLELSPAEPGTDHAGASTPSWAVGDVGVAIGDIPVPLSDVVAIDGPHRFDEWGIGGFLSPQHLHPSAWVVIDMVANQCLLVDGDAQEVSAWTADLYPQFRLLSLSRESPDLLVVQAAIEPFRPVPTMLNTGTEATEFAASAVADLRGGSYRVGGRGVSGTDVAGQELIAQTLHVGGVSLHVPVLVVRDQMPHVPAMIGMDLLAGSVLVISPAATEPIQWFVSSG